MYETSVKGDKLFQVTASGYGQPITTFGVTDKGETPMSLVVIALASCITMCVQGYFARIIGQKDLFIEVSATYEESCFNVLIQLDEALTVDRQTELEAYIADKCRVKQLFKEAIDVKMTFTQR